MELILIILPITITFLIALYVYFMRVSYLKVSVNESIKEPIVLKISVPANNDKKPIAAEQLLQSLHGIVRGKAKSSDHFSFEIVANTSAIYFMIVTDLRYKQFVENQIYAQYPNAQIMQIHDYAKPINKNDGGRIVQSTELTTTKDFFLPIRTYNSFEVDPLSSITSTISKLNQKDEVWIQVIARPMADQWQQGGKEYVNNRRNLTDAEGKRIALESGEGAELSQIETKNTKSGYQFVIRIVVKSMDQMQANHLMEDTLASFTQFQTAQFNSLSERIVKTTLKDRIRHFFLGKRMLEILDLPTKYNHRFLDEFEESILNTEELASIYHLPSKSIENSKINWAKSRKLDPPADIPKENARFFGVTDFRNVRIPVGIKKADRRRHMYLLGKTGTGKSMLMKNMVLGDIYDGEGVGVVDPHGDLVEEILDLIPKERMNDVVYLDPSDIENPIALNMLDVKEGESVELLADGIVSVFIKLFGNSWGPRLQYILTNTLQTLLLCQNVSLLAVNRILTDQNYRKFLLKQIDDPFIIKFWNEEFAALERNPKLIAEALSPIQNKVGRFLSSPLVRNMIGQVKSSIDLQEIMDNRKILLVNLSQGKIGEENTSLLGGMLITRLYTNAMQRAKLPESQRQDFYLYVDEFQNFATDTFVKILSEARKYALNLMVTHQFIDQLPLNIQDAIFGNVGTLMNYVVGPKDAGRLEKEYQPDLTAEDLVNLERFRMVLKLTLDGAQTKPFTAIATPPNYSPQNLSAQIKELTRKNYSSSKAEVESKLNKWAGQNYDVKGNLVRG